MVCHELRLSSDVKRRQVRKLQRLSLDPSQRLEVLEKVVVFGQLRRKLHTIVTSALRCPCYSLDLLDLLVVRRRDSVEEARNLGSKVGSRDERSKDVLRKNIGERACIILDIVI